MSTNIGIRAITGVAMGRTIYVVRHKTMYISCANRGRGWVGTPGGWRVGRARAKNGHKKIEKGGRGMEWCRTVLIHRPRKLFAILPF